MTHDDPLDTEDAGQGPGIVLIHGWPDSPRVWDDLGPRLVQAGFRVIRVCLPGFHGSPESRGAPFPKLAQRLNATLDALNLTKVAIIGHDWGAYLAYCFEQAYPNRVSRFVTMDVGAQVAITTPKVALATVAYQGWNLAAWLSGHALPGLGSWMTQQMARLVRAPSPETVPWSANYPYYHIWKARLSGTEPLARYRPTRPLLYLYGEKKPFHFHTAQWLEAPDRVVSVPGAAHWLMLDAPELVCGEILAWLTEEDRAKS